MLYLIGNSCKIYNTYNSMNTMYRNIFVSFIYSGIILYACLPVFANPQYHVIEPDSIKGIFQEEVIPEVKPEEKKGILATGTFDTELWNNLRRLRETGTTYKPEIWKPYRIEETTTTVKQIGQDRAKRAFDVELAYESGLSIKGTKTIDVKFSQKKYKNESTTDPDRKMQVNTFEMAQTLRVDIEGRVGRKITVDVHFDDTQENKRDISVVYKGDPDEVVQEAAFGDITLSLPQTQFVNYNKQVFGIKAELKYKKMRFMAIGSRTKGITETKVFTGKSQLGNKTIRDRNYIKLKYYKPFDVNIERDSIRIWFDDKDGSNNVGISSMTVKSSTSTTVFQGIFEELKSGVDFTYDPITNVVMFRRSVGSDDVVAIYYKKSDGAELNSIPVILKDERNTDGITREMKNYYYLGRKNIINDNFRGNFTFEIQELDQTIPTVLNPGNKEVPVYPKNVEIDFDTGIFYFKKGIQDFDELRAFPGDVYSFNKNLYNIFVEYRYIERDYRLGRANIVLESERVLLDGVLLTRDVDYYIIYEIGSITFYDEDRLTDMSKIEVTYEYAPFGGQFGQTLVGSRLEFSPLDRFFIGSSVLYNFSAKPAQIPDMRSQPDSTMVWDVDSRIQDISFGNFPFKIRSLKGEYAQSIYNPNIFGKAIIQSMEGIKEDDTLSTNEDFWLRASNPPVGGYSSTRMQYDAVSWANQDVKTSEIYLGIGTPKDIWWEDEDEQQVLLVNYDFSKTDANEVSLVQVLSRSGRDFSEKLLFEVIFYDGGKGEDITFDLGEIDEDADGDGLDLETEDLNRNNTLDKDEDIGWNWSYPGLPDVPFEPDNGRIDREDLDGDDVMDGKDILAWSYTIQSQGYAGWRYASIPLEITDADAWKNIKQLRLVISKGSSSSSQGMIKIARIGIVGNRFDIPSISNPGTDTSMIISALNNQDNPGYDSLLNHPAYGEIYPDASDKKKEQALQIEYNNFTAATAGYTKLGLRSIDVSHHKKLKFFVYNNDSNKKDVFIRFGTESNYFEFEINFDQGASPGWGEYTIILEDLTGDDIADRMIYGNTSRKGQELAHPTNTIPSLKNIAYLIIGVRGVEGSGSFWVNEFYVDTAVKQVGHAATFSGSFEVPGWATFGGSYQEKDKNFRTIASTIFGQDSFSESGNLSFTRIKFLPMNFTASKSKTRTPSALETGSSGLISVLEEGKVLTESYSGNATLSISRLPQLRGDASRTLKDYSKLRRKDITENAGGTLTYSNPIQTPVLHLFPTSISARYSRSNYRILHDSGTVSNIDSLEYTDSYSGSLSFTPWKNFSVKPSWNLTTVREAKYYSSDEQAASIRLQPGESRKIDIPKSLRQTVKGNVNITILRWLRPTANYSHTLNVNYDILSSTNVITKTVNRISAGKVNWVFQPRNFYGLRNFTPVKSMNITSSYSINDGDSYEKIPRPFYVQNSIWVRKPLQKEFTQYDLFTSTAGVININAPRRRSLTTRDTQNYTARWSPLDWVVWFKGPLEPIKTISTTNTLTKSHEMTDNTGTVTRVLALTWPNIDISMRNVEKLLYTGWFMRKTRINGKVFKKVVETIDKSERIDNKKSGDINFRCINFFDTYLTYSRSESESFFIQPSTTTTQAQRIRESLSTTWSRTAQIGFNLGAWRFTPSYTQSKNQAFDREAELTTDKMTHNAVLKIRGDMNKPKDFRIPFTGIGFLMRNRLILDSTISWDIVRSPQLNVTKDNTNTGKASLLADYELSANIRIKFGMSGTMFRNLEQNEDDYDEYSGSAGLTIQF